jgi:hypothetical protein
MNTDAQRWQKDGGKKMKTEGFNRREQRRAEFDRKIGEEKWGKASNTSRKGRKKH